MARRKLGSAHSNGYGWKIALLVLGLAGMAAAGGWLYFTSEPAPDPVTLCPANGPMGHTVLLVDNTEQFGFIQRQALRQRLRTLADGGVPEGHLLSVFVLGANFTEQVEPIFERCNPGTGAGRSSLNANPVMIQKRYSERFAEPLQKLADQVVPEKAGDQSPIFEMLQIASLNGFARVNTPGSRTLIMYSDMIPHMPAFSMFKGVPDFEQFSQSAYARKTQARLDGVDVHLNYLLNYPQLQTRRQSVFWERWFDQAGAYVREHKTFEG